MKIYSVTIENFRGIRSCTIILPDHAVLIGDNNTGKSSVSALIKAGLLHARVFSYRRYLAILSEGTDPLPGTA